MAADRIFREQSATRRKEEEMGLVVKYDSKVDRRVNRNLSTTGKG
jgi:hypothetical protein